MSFAASLLLDPGLLVEKIASMTEYKGVFQFSRTFKSVYGQSPSTFRQLRV
jgi:AraC-like DNA-binding protein